FWWLVLSRVAQGFFGGFLIPLVFSAVFLMFDGSARVRATMVAGVMAMLAPTLGPTVGGFITDRFSWHWLFLINVPVGIVVAGGRGSGGGIRRGGGGAAWMVAIDGAEGRGGGGIDLVAAPLLAVFLAGLQVVLSEAPAQGWS